MNAAQIVGALMLAGLFVAYFAWIVKDDGWAFALALYGATAGFVVFVAVAVALLTGDLP